MIVLSAVQSFVHSAFLFINTLTMLATTKIIGYLVISVETYDMRIFSYEDESEKSLKHEL